MQYIVIAALPGPDSKGMMICIAVWKKEMIPGLTAGLPSSLYDAVFKFFLHFLELFLKFSFKLPLEVFALQHLLF